VIEKMIGSVSEGPTFVILAGVSLVSSALLILQWKYGASWIRQREERKFGALG
jgi:hypothetical protein